MRREETTYPIAESTDVTGGNRTKTYTWFTILSVKVTGESGESEDVTTVVSGECSHGHRREDLRGGEGDEVGDYEGSSSSPNRGKSSSVLDVL